MDDNYPAIVLENVAKSIPQEFHKLIVVIGSLAAGYHFFGDDKSRSIRTKDVDCMVIPRVAAVNAGKKITQKLLELGWEPKASEEHPFPANPDTSEADLPGIRLYPPGHRGWFLEFLTEPDPDSERNQQWSLPFNLENARQAIFAFTGAVFQGIDVNTIPKNKLDLKYPDQVLSWIGKQSTDYPPL